MKSIRYAERDIKLFVDVFPQANEIEYEGLKLSDVVRRMLIDAYQEGWEAKREYVVDSEDFETHAEYMAALNAWRKWNRKYAAQIREGSLTDANGKH